MKMNFEATFLGRKNPMDLISQFDGDLHPKYDSLSFIIYKLFRDDPEFYKKLDLEFKNNKNNFKETLLNTLKQEFKMSISDLKTSIKDQNMLHKDKSDIDYLETSYSIRKKYDNLESLKSSLNNLSDVLVIADLNEEDIERAYKYAKFMYDFDKDTSKEIYKQHHR